MRLPLTLISTHALLVHVEQYRFAISDRGVEQILYPGSGEIRQLGNHLTYQVGDNIYELHFLEALLDLAAKEKRGKLKVFLGMAPGVGKTYAMLGEGRRNVAWPRAAAMSCQKSTMCPKPAAGVIDRNQG